MLSEENWEDDLIKGIKLIVVPRATTPLKALQARNKVFKCPDEMKGLEDLKLNEATPVAITRSWTELGFPELEEVMAPNDDDTEIWTEIGYMKTEELELFFQFLERFREIIEDEKLTVPEKINQVRNMNDSHGFLNKLMAGYGPTFPEIILRQENNDS